MLEFLTSTPPRLELHLDAQATEGMLLRQGAGKLKHLSVRTLWVQGAVADFQIRVVKLPRSLNHADALCSFHTAPEFHQKLAAIGLRVTAREGSRRGGAEQQNQEEDRADAAMHVTTWTTRRKSRIRRLMAMVENLSIE